MKIPFVGLALTSTLALPLAAQDSPLVVRTSNPEIAMGMAGSFGSLDPLPDLTAGRHYVLALSEGGIEVSTESGDASLMQITARPGPLMDLFADEIAQYQGVVQGMMMMSMGQQGFQPADVAAMAQAVMGFPDQVDLLNLSVTGDPLAMEQGLGAELSLTPKQGSWFSSLVGALTKAPAGAPMLTGAGADMQMAVGMSLESLEPFAPFMDLLAGMAQGSDEEKQKRADMLSQTYQNVTGTMGMSWDLEGGGMQIIAGLKDPDAAAELLQDPSYAELTASFATAGVEIDYQPNALEYRGVNIHKTTMDMGAMMATNPLFPSGTIESYYAVAGNYTVTSMYSTGETRIKALIDSVLDDKIEFAQLPGDTLGTFTMDLTELMKTLTPGAPPPGSPKRLSMDLAKTDGQLRIKLDMK